MEPTPHTGIVLLVHLHWLLGGTALAALIAWIFLSRRQATGALPLWQRTSLLGILVVALMARWFTGQSFSGKFDIPPPTPATLPEMLADNVNLAVPSATSLIQPEIKVLGGKSVLMLPPPTTTDWPLRADVRAVSLEFGFDPIAYERGQSNGADVILELRGPASNREIFRRRLDPRRRPADRGLQRELVILPPFEPGAQLRLRTDAGEFGDAAWDWLYLAQLRFPRDPSLARRQFPGFSRAPNAVTGDNSALLPRADGSSFLLLASPSVATFVLHGDEHRFEFAYGFLASAYTNGGRTNGAGFCVDLQSGAGLPQRLFERSLTPVEQPADRDLQRARVSLPAVRRGDQLILRILPGDHDDRSWDHTFIEQVDLD